jgi:hypothetical protein
MKLSEEIMWGNPILVSDGGHTFIVKRWDGKIGFEGFDIHLSPEFHAEDIDMRKRPEEIWEEFFRQSSPDGV